MMTMLTRKLLLGFAIGCLAAASAKAELKIKVDGSSTVYPITEATGEEFRKQRTDVAVEVVVSGTGGGFAKFCRGETDISNASRPISKKEMAACREAGIDYLEIPVGYDALTVVVNKKNDAINSLTPAQLKKLWEPAAKGKIVNWNQLDPNFPDLKLRLYGPGGNSGTFDYFTEAVVGKSKQSRDDYIASEDDYLIVRGVTRNPGAVGYFGYAYYLANQRKLKAVAIDSGKGPVLPSRQTVENGTYAPLSRPIFIYLSNKALERPEVRAYADFYLKNAPRIVAAQNYVPLPASIYTINARIVQERRTGTVYGGEEAHGIGLEELLKRPPRH